MIKKIKNAISIILNKKIIKVIIPLIIIIISFVITETIFDHREKVIIPLIIIIISFGITEKVFDHREIDRSSGSININRDKGGLKK